jgi:hypothetical protein
MQRALVILPDHRFLRETLGRQFSTGSALLAQGGSFLKRADPTVQTPPTSHAARYA